MKCDYGPPASLDGQVWCCLQTGQTDYGQWIHGTVGCSPHTTLPPHTFHLPTTHLHGWDGTEGLGQVNTHVPFWLLISFCYWQAFCLCSTLTTPACHIYCCTIYLPTHALTACPSCPPTTFPPFLPSLPQQRPLGHNIGKNKKKRRRKERKQ